MTFLRLAFSALLGPVFAAGLPRASGGADSMERAHYQAAVEPPLYGVAFAVTLARLLKETGAAAIAERGTGARATR